MFHKEPVEARMVNQTEPKRKMGKSPTAKPIRRKKSSAVDRGIRIQKALYEIADAASAVTDMQKFYAELHRIVGKLMYAKNFYVTLYDPATRMLSSPYFADKAGDVPPAPARLDPSNRSLRGVVLLTGKTLHVSAEEIEKGRRRGKFTPMGTPAEDWIGVPLKMDGLVIGSLTVQSYKKGIRYAEQDVQLLEFVAQHIAVALTRARAIEETRQRNHELEVINSVQEGLASNLDIQSIYTLVGDKLREIFAADTTFIAFRDEAKNLLHVDYYADRVLRRSFRRPYGTGIAEVIIDSGNPLLLRNELEQQELGALHVTSPGAEKDLNESVLGVPVFRDGKACGAVTVQSYKVNAFDENHLRLLQTLTNSMSIALENARLWEQEKLYRKALERELEIGREIQAGFLPEELPRVEGWEIAAALMSAREVAGDFYDAFELPEGHIGLVIADVCDKGVGAALFMTLFRSLIRITANREYYEAARKISGTLSTAERLQNAMLLTNNYIAETHFDSGMFATLFFGVLDPRNGSLIYINGGHEPPLIIHSGAVRESLHKTGPAVGAIPDCHFDVHTAQLNPGEMLIAFTDGAPEAKNLRGEFFGRQRLLDIPRRCFSSSQKLVNTIQAELQQYIEGATQFDDITLLAVRRDH
jgi:serine phosphatase RsbU (regulator of sigma subunit)